MNTLGCEELAYLILGGLIGWVVAELYILWRD